MKSPAQVAIEAQGSEARVFAVYAMIEALITFAKPLTPALRERVLPWTIELQRRRETLLEECRRSDRKLQAAETGAR